MADIFISYSKPDRFEVEKLAAMLEAEGWSVWWDKSLSAGDTYRDEIMKQLSRARAVIAVWTANSVLSDWVRAEAGQAKANGKLIPVKADGVGYGDIPLPFGEMHTEPISNTAQIRAAVVAQLAKPQVAPSGFWMATADVRYAFLTWFGIIGGAITLFTSLKGVITLADWAKILVENWTAWTHAFWRVVMGWTGVRVPHALVPLLNFILFVLSSIIAIRIRYARRDARLPDQGYSQELPPPSVWVDKPIQETLWLIGAAVWFQVMCSLFAGLIYTRLLAGIVSDGDVFLGSSVFVILTLIFYVQQSRERVATATTLVLLIMLLVAIVLVPASRIYFDWSDPLSQQQRALPIYAAIAIFTMVPMVLTSVSATLINRRFLFILAGVAVMVS